MAKVSFVVTAEVPDGVTITDAKQYIRDALGSWGGSFEPPNEQNGWTGNSLFVGLVSTVRTLGSPQGIGNRAAAIADKCQADHLAQRAKYKRELDAGGGDRGQLQRFIKLHETEAGVAQYLALEIRNKLGSTT